MRECLNIDFPPIFFLNKQSLKTDMISTLITTAKGIDILTSYFAKKGLDWLITTNPENFQNRLKTVIDKTIIEYMETYPVKDLNGKHAFYKSQRVIDELLKYRLMANDYDLIDLENAFDDEINVISPKKEEIENFYGIFIEKINADETLKQLEISSTFDAEIFKISRKVDSIKKNIESIINNINTQLDSEWERQIIVYKENISKFKPVTALDLLLKLESSFELSQKAPTILMKATIEYLKGQCHELIGNSSEMHECYIKAYRLDSNPVAFKEKACFSFAIKENQTEAQKIVTEIFEADIYNTIAWAVNVMISQTTDILEYLENVPKIVLEDINFKRIIYITTRTKFDINLLNRIYEKLSILHGIEHIESSPLTFKNYKIKLFQIEYLLSKVFQTLHFDFKRAFTGDIELVKIISPIIDDFLKKISESEIIKNYKILQFYNDYFQFVLRGDQNAVIKMKLTFDSLDVQDEIPKLIIIDCLQQINKDDDAIQIINKQKNKSIELLHFEAFIYLKNNDITGYIKCFHNIAILTKEIDLISCENLLGAAYTIYINGRAEDISIEDFIKDKKFEFDYLKVLLEEFLTIILKKNNSDTILKLQEIEGDLLSSKSKIIFHLSLSYYLLEEFELAINFFKRYIDKEYESRDLFFYIKSLDRTNIHNEELLPLLKHWRLNFSFIEEFLRIEGDLRRQLSDWKECAEICKFFLSKHKDEESFLTLYLISINEIETTDKDEIIEEIASIFSNYDFKYFNNAITVSNILIQNNYHKIALNILYKQAIVRENKQARMAYFLACVNIPFEIIKDKEIVDIGLFVKYEINDVINFIEINDSNSLAKSLLGHKIGDEVIVQNPLFNGFDSVRILRIMDKFLCLHDEIVEEVKNNPYSGIPMQSITFKDTSPEGMIQTLVSLMGANGTLIKKKHENALLKYYNYELSFSEIIFQNYSLDYIGGYFNLIHHADGFTLIPAIRYQKIEVTRFNNIVLDFTSLLIFFQISKVHNICFTHKFIISKGILDYLKDYKKKEGNYIGEQISISVSLDGITKSTRPEDIVKSNIQYLISLIQWIEENCIIKIVESRLNITRKLDGEIKNEIFANYIVDNMSLLMEYEDSLLITDDSIHLKLFPLDSEKTCSSELYIGTYFGSNTDIMSEFIKNKYIGITISKEILVNEFNKKMTGQVNCYNHCLNNLSLSLNPNRLNVHTAIQFLKEITISSLLIDDSIRQEAINIFVVLLRGQNGLKIYRIIELLIEKEFKLLGAKLDLIHNSFQDALAILTVSKQ